MTNAATDLVSPTIGIPGGIVDEQTTLTHDDELSIGVEVDDAGEIRVLGEVTIHHVAALYVQLKAIALGHSVQASLNLSAVTAIDTSGVQLLVAFKRLHPGTVVHSSTHVVRQFLELVGMTTLLL
jgi:anti-anti-sigma regulatory factor